MVQLSMLTNEFKISAKGNRMNNANFVNAVLVLLIGVHLYGTIYELVNAVSEGESYGSFSKMLLVTVIYSMTATTLCLTQQGRNKRLFSSVAYFGMVFLFTHLIVGVYFAILISFMAAAYVFMKKYEAHFVTSVLTGYWVTLISVSIMHHNLIGAINAGLGQIILEIWSTLWAVGTEQIYERTMIGFGAIVAFGFGILSNKRKKEAVEDESKSKVELPVNQKNKSIDEIRAENKRLIEEKVRLKVKEKMNNPETKKQLEENESGGRPLVQKETDQTNVKTNNSNGKKSKKFFNIQRPTIKKKIGVAKETILRKLSK